MSPRRERLLKRTNPSGKVVWVARFTDSRGRRRVARPPWNKGKGTFDREYKAQEAIDWAHEQERRPESDTVAGYLSTWTQVHPRAERTNETNRHRISRVLDVEVDGVAFRDWELRDVRRRHINVLVDAMLRDQGRAQTGAVNILRSLSAMWEDVITDEKAEVNPVKGVRVRANDPRIRRPRRAVRVFSFEEMHEFAAAARRAWIARHPTSAGHAPVIEVLVRTFADTGARLGEVLPLRRTGLKSGTFEIHRSAHEGTILEGTKTDHGDATPGRKAPCPPTP
jgi:integrase